LRRRFFDVERDYTIGAGDVRRLVVVFQFFFFGSFGISQERKASVLLD